MIATQTIEQVRAYGDIIGIISDYVTLKKRGRNYLGLCPFHQEKSPSFTVSPDKHLWHCFGCHASGDHIGFLMQIENMTFSEAVSHIANKAGIEIIETEQNSETSKKEKEQQYLLDLLYQVRTFYEEKMPQSPAFHYLSKRGFTQEIIKKFHLGFGDTSEHFLNHCRQQNWDLKALHNAGVLSYYEDQGYKVRFHNRAMFPIIDHRGRTIAFGGRTLEKNDNVKYINSDETLLFNKRKVLYGLDQAKSTIQKENSAILMEGYLDVIAAHQFGFTTAIGTMGTALTFEHAQLLKRLVKTIILMFDSDNAGQQAILRSYTVLKPLDFQIYVAQIPEKDPADFLFANGPDAFREQLRLAIPFVEFLITSAHTQWRGRVEEIPDLLQEILPILDKEKDLMIQRHYIKKIATLFKLETEWVLAKMKRIGYNAPKAKLPIQKSKTKYQKACECILYWMSTDLEKREFILTQLKSNEFEDLAHRELFEQLASTALIGKDYLLTLSENTLLMMTLSQILLNGEMFPDFNEEGPALVLVLKQFHTENYIKTLQRRIAEADTAGEDDTIYHLLNELQGLLGDQSMS